MLRKGGQGRSGIVQVVFKVQESDKSPPQIDELERYHVPRVRARAERRKAARSVSACSRSEREAKSQRSALSASRVIHGALGREQRGDEESRLTLIYLICQVDAKMAPVLNLASKIFSCVDNFHFFVKMNFSRCWEMIFMIPLGFYTKRDSLPWRVIFLILFSFIFVEHSSTYLKDPFLFFGAFILDFFSINST